MSEKIAKTVDIRNKKAGFEFSFIENYSAGMVLTGTEIKSIRQGKFNFNDSFCLFLGEGLFVRSLNISKYGEGGYNNHDPLRDRKLLLTKKELKKLGNKLTDKGLTIVPTRLYINEKGYAKIDISLAKGKKLYDKRETIKERDVQRETGRNF
jgi:SsrA-binding protein